MLNKTAEFMPHEKITTTSKGIRYLKDNEISQSLKEHFANNSFIKKMAKNMILLYGLQSPKPVVVLKHGQKLLEFSMVRQNFRLTMSSAKVNILKKQQQRICLQP